METKILYVNIKEKNAQRRGIVLPPTSGLFRNFSEIKEFFKFFFSFKNMEDKKNGRFRDFCFTINNYSASDIAILDNIKCDYIIYGKEVGEKGTPHLQCYIYIKNKISFNVLKKTIHRAHIEVCKGTSQQNIDYCKKQGDYVERGITPQQGKRTDLENVKHICLESGKMADIVLEAKSYQSIKMAEQILKYHEQKRTWQPDVYWLYGEAGSGKTRYVYDRHNLDDIYVSMTNLKWWEGYDKHEVVLLDDFRKTSCSYQELLRILDRYPYRVENKGGSRQLLAKTIYISCPFHPKDLYKDVSEDIQQLMRRIKEIILFGEYKEELLQNEFSEL